MGVLQHTLGALGTTGAPSSRCVHSPGWDPRAVRRWGFPAGPLGELPEARRPRCSQPRNPELGGRGSPHVGKNGRELLINSVDTSQNEGCRGATEKQFQEQQTNQVPESVNTPTACAAREGTAKGEAGRAGRWGGGQGQSCRGAGCGPYPTAGGPGQVGKLRHGQGGGQLPKVSRLVRAKAKFKEQQDEMGLAIPPPCTSRPQTRPDTGTTLGCCPGLQVCIVTA